MPNPSTLVVTTGKAGPAGAVSGLTLTGVSELQFRMNNSVLQAYGTFSPGTYREFDIAATATITATIASGVMTLTINQ